MVNLGDGISGGVRMAKRGPKPKLTPLSVRVQFRISPETKTAYDALAEVLDIPPAVLMRQALDETAGTMITLATAFGQMKEGQPVRGLGLYRQFLESLGPQLEVQRQVSDVWLEQVIAATHAAASATVLEGSEGGTMQ